MNTAICLRYLSRTLKGTSLFSQWIGSKDSLQLSITADLWRIRLRTVRIARNTFYCLADPHTSLKLWTESWVTIGDAAYSFSKKLKIFNYYCPVHNNIFYNTALCVGAVAKIGTATYKIFFVEMNHWKRAKQTLLVIRKINFLRRMTTGRSYPSFHLTLLTAQLICEVVIDCQKNPK